MKIRAKRIAALALAAVLCVNTAVQAAPVYAGKVQTASEAAASSGTEKEPETKADKETEKETGTEKTKEKETEKEPGTEKENGTEKATEAESESESGTEKAAEAESETGAEKATEPETGKSAESETEAKKETEPSTEKKTSETKKAPETETGKKTKAPKKNPSKKNAKDQKEETKAPDLDESDAEETVTDVVTETYLKEHVNRKYVPEAEKVELASAMVAKQTLVDRAVTGNSPTIDGVMASSRKGDALITQFDSAVALYDLSEDSRYYVGLVNTMLNDAGAAVTDYAFAEYNKNGVLLDGCYYEKQTGIAYVPKSLLKDPDGKILIGYVQVQLLQVIGYTEGENVESSVLSGTVVDGEAEASASSDGIFSMETTVQAKAGLDEESVEVAVNGIPLDEGSYQYNKASGEVVISRSSATVGTVSVTADEETIFTKIRKFLSPKSKAATPATMDGINAAGSIHVDASLDVTKAVSGTADFLYAKSGEAGKPMDGYVLYTANPGEDDLKKMSDFITKESGSLKADSELYKASNETNFWIHLDTLDLGDKYSDLIQFKDLDDETAVALTCAHIGNYLGVNSGQGQDVNGSWFVKGADVKVRVLYVDNEAKKPFVLLGIVTETVFTQTGTGIVKLYTFSDEEYGKLRIKKSVDNPEKLERHKDRYDLSAVFGVYSSKEAAEKKLISKANRPGIVRTGPKGHTKQAAILEPGNYWVREIREEGEGIWVSDQIRKVKIEKNKVTKVGFEVDDELCEPTDVPIVIKKTSSAPDIVAGNPLYGTFDQARYGMYADQACTQVFHWDKALTQPVIFSLGADGTGPEVWLSYTYDCFGYGTYYAKEVAAPTGYCIDTAAHPFTINKDTKEIPIDCVDVPKVAQADIKLKKVSAGKFTGKTTEGAVFKVEYFMNYDCSGTAARTWYFKSKRISGEDGVSESNIAFTQEYLDTSRSNSALFEMGGKNVLPLGSIRVTEEQAPNGYVATDAVFTGTIRDPGASSTSAVFTWSDGNTAEYEREVPNESRYGGIVLQKVDEVVYAANGSIITAESKEPQGDASLAGAVFAVYNANDYDVVTRKDKEKAIAPGEEVCRITTDDKGMGQTEQMSVIVDGRRVPKEILQADSSYRIVEINPSTGMKVKDGFDVTITLPDVEDYRYGEIPEEILELTCPEPIKRGDVQVQKLDKELNKSEALAGKGHGSAEDVPDLSGIGFEIRNISEHPVFLYGDPEQEVSNEPGKNLCMTVTTHWNEAEQAYTAETTGRALPYGTYTIQEVSTNNGYLLTDGEVKTFCIREDGEVVKIGKDGEPLVFKNQVVRGDVKFNKIAEKSGRRMQTAWVITNNATGEAHVAVTDRNGFFDSSATKNKHTYHTNANDGLLEYKGTEYVIKTSEMDDQAGIWFGKGESGTMAKADDTLRALPYGSYTLTELRCEENEGFDLKEFTFWVSDNDAVVDLGTLTDLNEPKISTSAVDKVTKEHFGKAGKDTVIIDTVHCTGLDKGTEYTLRASIHDYADDDTAFKVDGRRVRAEKTFKATSATMDVPVEIAFDATAYAGMTGVVYEELYRGDIKEAEHTDITDEAQRICFPKIGTQARDEKTGDGVYAGVNEDGRAVIIDTVSYQNLTPGKEYTIKGTIYDKDTGKEASGMVEKNFTPEEPDGTVELRFEFEPDKESESFVAFEKLYYGDAVIAEHEDLEDEGQTVRKPSISTTAKDSETGTGEAFADEEVTVIDTVAYTNLKAGLTYTLKGILMDKTTGEPLLVDGKEVTAEAELVPETAEGTIDMEFTFNASGMEGKSLVVFEELYHGEILAASHSDIEDEGQTITFPEIKTKAEDAKTKLNESLAEGITTVIDTVTYSGLTPGKTYTVSGVLMDKKTGEPLLADGKTVTATKEFVPEKADGSVQLSFTFNASALAGSTVVVFEDLHRDGKLVAVHADITDEDQTDYLPQIGTQAVDKETGTHEGKGGKNTVLVDTVAYRNLAPGTEYTVKGVLMDKKTGTELKVDGKTVTSEAVFTTPESGLDDNGRVSGTVELSFTFDATALKNSDTVVFERLYHAGKEVAVHTDLEDEGQTVRYPKLKTTATDKVTETHEQLASKRAAIVDTVTYSGLTPGKEYVMKGTLYDKSTKKPLKSGGKAVTAEKRFIPERESGTVELTFHFDSSALEGKTVVAFEELYHDGKLVGIHADIRDKDQSVRILKIRTKAKDKKTGGSTMTIGKDVVLSDTVAYKNLEEGKKYSIEGVVMDKETGNPVKIGGKEVTAKKTFRAQDVKGSTVVTFKLDTSAVEGKTLVVFEKLYDNKGNLVAVHEDINDKGQTVTVPKENTPKGGKSGTFGYKSPKTGDETAVIPLIAMAAVSAGILLDQKLRRRKKKGAGRQRKARA